MTNTYCNFLIALLIASSACLANAQSQSSVAIITGEIRDPTAREITFSYELPSALESSEERVVLDSLNRFACELPVVRGTLVRGRYEGGQSRWEWVQWLGAVLFDRSPLVFFVEPGDSLHVAVEESFFGPSYSFSGPNADNSRLIAEWFPRFYSFRLDYEDLEVEDFKRQIDQRRQDQFEFLAERREQYALSPGFIDYATAYFNYGWANRMISYPTDYRFANGHKNGDITPEYYDFLQEISLADEKAIGVGSYHIFLERTLAWESWEILSTPRRPSGAIGPSPRDRGELGGVPRRSWQLSEMYDIADLELSEETVAQLNALYEKEGQRPKLSQMVDLSVVGLLSATQARLDSIYERKRSLKLSQMFDLSALGLSQAAQAEFDSFFEKSGRSYGFTSSKEGVAKVDTTGGTLVFHLPAGLTIDEQMESLRKTLKLSEKVDLSAVDLSEATRAQLAPEFTLDDLDGQPVSLSQFKGQVVLLDFWASWCGPCISDLPNLRRIKEKTATLPVVFLNISLDADEAAWREAIDKHEIEGVHMRANGFSSDVAKSYQVTGIPSYYLVDAQGLILENPIIRDTDEIVATIEKSL